MAKDLPYFKFFCSEWSDGDITLESFETQGLFINICAYYWSNECSISLDKTKKKFKLCNDINLENLINSGIIKIIEGNISINFLNEQQNERSFKSLTNSENGKKGGRPKKPTESEIKPNALFSLSETKANKKAIREEKKREENKIEENNKALPFNFFDSLINLGAEKQLVSDWISVRKLKKLSNTITAFEGFKNEFSKSGKNINDILKECVINSWGGFKAEWINKNNTSVPIIKKRVIS